MRFRLSSVVVVLVWALPIAATTLRAELTTSYPDRWLHLVVLSRTDPTYPAKDAQHIIQSNCSSPGSDFVTTDFVASSWSTPTSPADPIVFTIDAVDPLEILDFHIRVSACRLDGTTDGSHPWVTGTLRLFTDGELISTTSTRVRNCCEMGWDGLPLIATYPISATPPNVQFVPSNASASAYAIMNRAQPLGYPSPYQARLASDPNIPDVGGMAEIEIRITGSDGAPAVGADVYATVIDPPDPAPYRSDRHDDDNRDVETPTVSGAPGYQVGTSGDAVILRTDPNGMILARLQGSKSTAGDNYRLRIAFYSPLPADAPCSRSYPARPCFESDIFTIWKRALVENDQMLRTGTFLSAPYAGGPTVNVAMSNTFKPAAGATLVFIHAPTSGEGFWSEVRSITKYKNGVLTLSSPLARSYDGPRNGQNYLADAVGLVAGMYDVSISPLRTSLQDAFIDLRQTTQMMPLFPYMGTMTEPQMQSMSQLWRQGDADVHLIAARYAFTPKFGSENAGSSFVWTQQCIDYTSATDPFKDEIAAHEVIHRWDVNLNVGRSGDHCDLNAYSNAGRRCTMHTYVQQDPNQPGSPVRTEFRDGIVEFHYVLQQNGPDSECMALRSSGGVQ
ncbi:MAG TPA: hypothetical protein VHW00_18055 [Thermoanaerobaculia bacterium]|nr:hypothetical protein [Thermoanaerobaculia bacterium]